MRPIPYVQRVRRPDGRVDLYFRKGAVRRKLKAADGTAALEAEVRQLLTALESVAEARKPRSGTISGALGEYQRSAEFLVLAASTQREYERVAAHITADCGEVRLSDVTSGFVLDLNAAWALHGYRAADIKIQILKNALTPAVKRGLIAEDAFKEIIKNRRPHDLGEPNLAWTDEEVDAFIEEAIARAQPGLARAVALARYAGFRRGTICAIPLRARVHAHDEQGGLQRRLFWMTEKRQVRSDKREDPRLTQVLARTPNRALTIAYNKAGHRWQERQLNQAVERVLSKLAERSLVRGYLDDHGQWRSPLTIHGLRHARGVELADAGASDAEIMAQIEHLSERAARIYRRQAERKRLSDAGQDKVDAAVERIRRRSGAGTSGEPQL